MPNHLGRQIGQGHALVGVNIHVQYQMNSIPCGKNQRHGGIRDRPLTLWMEEYWSIWGAQITGPRISLAAYEVVV